MEKLSPKQYALRWFWASLSPFQATFAVCGSLASLVGLYCLAYPPNVGGSVVALVVLIISVGLLVSAWLLGVFVTPYRMSIEEAEKAELRALIEKQKSTTVRMAEGIQNVISQLTEVCHQINSHKGTLGVPVNNCYELFNPIQDQIQRPIISQLKSLLPKEGKDV